jgi:hypothetical protein
MPVKNAAGEQVGFFTAQSNLPPVQSPLTIACAELLNASHDYEASFRRFSKALERVNRLSSGEVLS